MKKIKIGQIVRPFGLKGEVKVKLYTDFPELRFTVGMPLFLTTAKEDIDVVVSSFRMHQGFALVSFEGKPSIDDIEIYRNCELSIDEAKIEHDEDDIYYFDLVECTVVDESGAVLGKISEVIDTPAHAVIRIVGEGKNFLLPYVDAFIIDEDMEEKKITVRLIEGML
ncbi:MAG: 16S rRNA processing protein RimM [Firmicutes bacterium HGW-Firmicutes-10]|jgi:16S rRNA processing protein RimM|nr:MAG: 16S rRNA processing protein RimM [Firmicutes bacterium HGW-Firmicutes-10]